MKILLLALLLASPALADEYVQGHFRKDGTYVEPHYRTESNNTKFDNYSTKGNRNPYTGEKGYKPNDYDNYNSDNLYRPYRSRK